MAKEKSLKLNIVMNALLTMSSFIFPLITYPYASRVLLPEGMGRVAFATSLVAYVDMSAQLGIPVYGIRACARVRDDRERLSRTASQLLQINLICLCFTFAVFLLALRLVPRFQEDKLLYILMSVSVLCNSIGMEWLYKAMEEYTYITVRSVLCKLVAVIAMFLLVHAKEDYMIYGGTIIFAGSASNILNLIHAHRFIDLRIKAVRLNDLKEHLRPIFVFFAMSCATIIYTNLDKVMLGFMSSNAEVGYYDAAVKIKVVLVSVVTSLGAVLLPRLSYYLESGMTDEFERISRKALDFVVILSLPMSLYFTVFAPLGIYFLSGPAFVSAAVPMRIIMPTLVLIGLTNILGLQILVPLGREKEVLISEIGGAIADLILNALLIPVYGAAGAAFGTLIAELAVFLIQCWMLRGRVGLMFAGIQYEKILMGLAAGAVVSIAARSFLNTGVFLTLLFTGILFFGLYGTILLYLREPAALELAESILRKSGLKHE